MHDLIPILPRDDAEQNGDSLARCGEVGVPVAREEREKKKTSAESTAHGVQCSSE